MNAILNAQENRFFFRLFCAVAIGIFAVVAWSDSLVAVLVRLWILERFA